MLQLVEAYSYPGNVWRLRDETIVGHVPVQRSVHAIVKLGTDRVVEASELSLGVLDTSGELWVFPEPAIAEPGVAFELGDAVLGSRDPSVEVLEGRLGVGRPVPLCQGLTPSRGQGDAAPAVPLASSDMWEVHPVLGVLPLPAGVVELAGGSAGRCVVPRAGPVGEVLTASA